MQKQRKPAIIVQGGAFTNMTGINGGELIKGTKESARAGYDVLTAPVSITGTSEVSVFSYKSLYDQCQLLPLKLPLK